MAAPAKKADVARPLDERSGVAACQGTWPTFKRLFFGYVCPHWRIGLVAVVAMVAVAATQTGVVALIQPLLDDGFLEKDAATIRFYAMVLIALILFQGVAHFFAHYLVTWIGRGLVKALRSQLHGQLLSLPNRIFDHAASGRLISKLTYEAEQVAGSVTRAVLALVQDTARILFLLGYMIYLSPLLMLIVAVVAPIVGGLIAYVTQRFRKITQRVHRAVGGVGSVAEETVHGYTVIKAFGQAERARQRFERVNERNRQQYMKFIATQYAAVPITRLLAGVALAAVIFLMTLDTVAEQITVGTFASFAGAALLLNGPLKSLVKVSAMIQKGLTAAQSIFQVIDTPCERDRGEYEVVRAGGRVEFSGVHFSYDSEREVLKGIDLVVTPGERIALVGPSGGGKSTLVHLLPRFYEPTAGEISLDGVALSTYRLAALRRQIAMVSQRVALFNATVGENIAYGSNAPVTEGQIWASAEAAHAAEFIERLPAGLDTPIGEDGVLLSGGQRQRIAIARALLKDAPLLILDEATSALDSESERAIQQALERLMQGRTTFVIAHRLATVENADQILVLEQGRIVECGRHAELLARGGRYAGLYRLQFADA
ncbi:lipid A export permease/ATP-binding protein MsbA [Halorhodospira abdelmalekii]|uniref:lipid A export permease/ATP-binding protein MsbA n=1 Tax=Halorhodospira abdelmalekii TaxID=421629 RepID=UPI003083FA0B